VTMSALAVIQAIPGTWPMEIHPEISVEIADHVAIVEIQRPPNNFFDAQLLTGLADIFEALDADQEVRAIVLAAAGKSFCAGMNHSREASGEETGPKQPSSVPKQALRLFKIGTPIVAAVQGSAVGGGAGLALAADFRVATPESRFWINFSRLGYHVGFGISYTLPRIVGTQKAAMIMYTGRRLDGVEAARIGIVDVLVAQDELRESAIALAREIAASAPLAVQSMRRTLRRGLADEFEAAMERELLEQVSHRQTADFAEGIRAMAERRTPEFIGR